MNKKATFVPDEIFEREMGLLRESLTRHANRRIKHTAWIDKYSTDREFMEDLDEELDHIFQGEPALEK